ncbi:hypothetical protein B4110_2531 [Parageobacillus toebii]|uniref:Uncharacterized protein n=1 Tax=Parageobacillus toebii TaxID=153151 RepID=A0A150MML7_9BACL|nr:hypothetical protein B4110_2531 [Parageobacillus toebii]
MPPQRGRSVASRWRLELDNKKSGGTPISSKSGPRRSGGEMSPFWLREK